MAGDLSLVCCTPSTSWPPDHLDWQNSRKPVLGKPPAHIFDDAARSVSAVQKAKRFREIITVGKGSATLAFDDFSVEFITNLEELRIAFSNDLKDSWCDIIKQNIASSLVHRDVFVDVVQTGAKSLSADEFVPFSLADAKN